MQSALRLSAASAKALNRASELSLQFPVPEIPYQIFLVLPYAICLVTMVWFLGKSRQPAAVDRIYDRESR